MSATPTVDRAGMNLRATLAKRDEDLRIARKHRDEAGARPMDSRGENRAAYVNAQRWFENRQEAEQAARGALIRYLQGA